MKNQQKTDYLVYGLLLIPFISGILALNHLGFLFKSGVAGVGILILFYLYFKELKRSKDVWTIMGAFLFSIVGDWFMSNRHGEEIVFIAGITLFFIAHIGYFTFALMNGQLNRLFTAIILAAFMVFFFLLLYPTIDDKALKMAAFVYLLISCLSLGAAIGISGNNWFKGLYVFGIVMIMFSDTVIALREFVKYRELDFLILPSYYLAQISITASLINRKIVDKNTNNTKQKLKIG